MPSSFGRNPSSSSQSGSSEKEILPEYLSVGNGSAGGSPHWLLNIRHSC